MKNNKMSFLEKLTGGTNIKNMHEIEDDFEDEESESHTEEQIEAELALDMFQTPTEIIIKTMVAGVKPEDLHISIGRDMITIKGAREMFSEVEEKDFFSQELFWGTFSRTVTLPEEIDPDNSEAIEKHGLLTIKLPKINKQKSKSLKVKSM